MIEKIKANWKVILIWVLLLFSLNKCSQSCNRQVVIDKQTVHIEQLDSTISVLSDEANGLRRDTADYLNRIRMYQGFGKSQDEMIRKQAVADSLNAVNNAKQKAQTDELIRQNKKLIENAAK